jgi:hypothetical protein
LKIFAGKQTNNKTKQMTAVRDMPGDKKPKQVLRYRFIYRAGVSVERHVQ